MRAPSVLGNGSALQRAVPWWETLALYVRARDCSLDAPVDGEYGDSWGDKLVSDEPQPDEAVHAASRAEAVRAAVDALPPKLATVIRKRFGFDGDPMRLHDIGVQMGLSRERIRQLECEALVMLRKRAELSQVAA